MYNRIKSNRTPINGVNKSKNLSLDINKREYSWPYILFYLQLNILGLYGLVVFFTSTSLATIAFTIWLSFLGIIGATVGAHRLWHSKSFKATAPLRAFLMLCQTLGGQGSIYDWVRTHKLHHERYRKDYDPYYSNENFFAAHVIANLKTLSPEQEKALETIDCKDLEKDDIVMFQKSFYWELYMTVFVLFPICAPLRFWGENLSAAIFVAFSLRYLIVYNVGWLIHSGHHIWASYNKEKTPDSILIFFITKSYWPQYHYMLPQDYQVNEFGGYGTGFSTICIRVFQALGLASDLMTISPNAVKEGFINGINRKKHDGVDDKKVISESIMECALKEFQNISSDCLTKKIYVQ